jgi:hypothetical protein
MVNQCLTSLAYFAFQIVLTTMSGSSYPKVLYDVSPHDFKIINDDHQYRMSSKVNACTSPTLQWQIYWPSVNESGLIVQQVSL